MFRITLRMNILTLALVFFAAGASAQIDPTAHLGVEGNWRVEWHDVTDPDSVTSALVRITRQREIRCIEGRMEGCVFQLAIPEVPEWTTNMVVNIDGQLRIQYIQSIVVDAGGASATIHHPPSVLGYWGGQEIVQQIGNDALAGQWAYRSEGGQASWSRIVPRFSALEISDETGNSSLVSHQAALPDNVTVNLLATGSSWSETQNFPGQRPSIRFELHGTELWGEHFATIPEAVGLDVSAPRSEYDENGVGSVWFTVTFWPGARSGNYRLLVDGQEFNLTLNIENQSQSLVDLDLWAVVNHPEETRPIDTFNPDAAALGFRLSEWAFVIEEKPGARQPDEFRLNLLPTGVFEPFGTADIGRAPNDCETYLSQEIVLSCQGTWTPPIELFSGRITPLRDPPQTGIDLHTNTLLAVLEGRISGGEWLELDRAVWSREFANCSLGYHNAIEPIRATLRSPGNPINRFDGSFNWIDGVDALSGNRLFPHQDSDLFELNTDFLSIVNGERIYRDVTSSEYSYLRTLADDLIDNKLDLREIDYGLQSAIREFVPSELYFVDPFQPCNAATFSPMMTQRVEGLAQLAQLRETYELAYQQATEAMAGWVHAVVLELAYYDRTAGNLVNPLPPVARAVVDRFVGQIMKMITFRIPAAGGWFTLARAGLQVTTSTVDLMQLEQISTKVAEGNAWMENAEYFRLAAERIGDFEAELQRLTDEMGLAYSENCVCAD